MKNCFLLHCFCRNSTLTKYRAKYNDGCGSSSLVCCIRNITSAHTILPIRLTFLPFRAQVARSTPDNLFFLTIHLEVPGSNLWMRHSLSPEISIGRATHAARSGKENLGLARDQKLHLSERQTREREIQRPDWIGSLRPSFSRAA